MSLVTAGHHEIVYIWFASCVIVVVVVVVWHGAGMELGIQTQLLCQVLLRGA